MHEIVYTSNAHADSIQIVIFKISLYWQDVFPKFLDFIFDIYDTFHQHQYQWLNNKHKRPLNTISG